MNRFFAVFILAAFVLLGPAGCGGSDPTSQTKTINELMAKDFPLTAQQRADVEKLVAEGNELVGAGNMEQAGVAFDAAIKILKFAEDAAMFNKSE